MIRRIVCIAILAALAAPLLAQDANKISKYVWVETERVNPAKQQAYAKVAKAFKDAAEAGKSDSYWLGMQNITGRGDEVTYVSFSDTMGGIDKMMAEFDGMAKQIFTKDIALAADAATAASDSVMSIAQYAPELSLHADLVPMGAATRYQVSQYRLRPGCASRFTDVVKDVIALDKDVPTAHWIMYRSMEGPGFTVVVPLRTLADLDTDNSAEMAKIFTPAVRRDLDARVRECVAEQSSNLSVVRPQYSRVPATVMAQNPSFWTVKDEQPMVAAAKPTGKRKSETPAAMKK
jgi:hypothetical protein